jgi:hypothetical protein
MGTTYHIRKGGSDSNPGSSVSAWAGLAHASTVLVAGDTCYIHTGTYTVAGITWSPTLGTSLSAVTVAAFPGDTPVFEGAHAANGFIVAGSSVNPSTFTIFNGFTVQNYGTRGNAPSGSGIWMGYTGSGSLRSRGNQVQSCTFKTIGSDIAQDHGVYCSYGNEEITVSNCIFIDIAGGAVQCWHSPGTQGINVFNNQVFGANWGLVLGDGASAVHITNNLFVSCNYAAVDSHFAGELDNGAFPASGTIQMHVNNNIFWGNAIAINVNVKAQSPAYHNNLFYLNTANGTIGTAAVTGINPKLVNFVSNGSGNYHLSSGSAAIDAGTSMDAPTADFDGNARPQNAIFDIGPYEFGLGGGDGIAGSSQNWRRRSLRKYR